jgi:hypothetical protein
MEKDYGLTRCLIIINFAIHAGGPVSRTGFPGRCQQNEVAVG